MHLVFKMAESVSLVPLLTVPTTDMILQIDARMEREEVGLATCILSLKEGLSPTSAASQTPTSSRTAK